MKIIIIACIATMISMNTNAQNIIHFNPTGIGQLRLGEPLPDTSHVLEFSKHPLSRRIDVMKRNFSYYFYPNDSLVLDSNLLIDYFIFARDANKKVSYIYLRFAENVNDIDQSLNASLIKGKWSAVSDFGGPSNALGLSQWYNKEEDSDIIFSRSKFVSGKIELRIYKRSNQECREPEASVFVSEYDAY